MTTADLASLRLHHQSIAPAVAATPLDAVKRLGAVQAQDYPSALWAVGLRTPGATLPAVEQAVARREIVRTWPMRGTLHLVPAEDASWMLSLMTPRVLAGSAGRRRQLELDEATLGRVEALMIAALQGGHVRSRPELFDALKQGGVVTDSQRGYHVLFWCALRGLICHGPRQGSTDTFVLLDEWVGPRPPVDREEALARLAERYVAGHGPATLHDFAWWSGLTMADVRAGIEGAGNRVVAERVNGQTYWLPADAPAPAEAPAARLLPAFDEYLLGYRDRSAVLDAAHAARVVPGSNGMFLPILVVNGRVVGVWKRTMRKTEMLVTFLPFEPIDPAHTEALAAAAGAYGRFLGLPVEIVT